MTSFLINMMVSIQAPYMSTHFWFQIYLWKVFHTQEGQPSFTVHSACPLLKSIFFLYSRDLPFSAWLMCLHNHRFRFIMLAHAKKSSTLNSIFERPLKWSSIKASKKGWSHQLQGRYSNPINISAYPAPSIYRSIYQTQGGNHSWCCLLPFH